MHLPLKHLFVHIPKKKQTRHWGTHPLEFLSSTTSDEAGLPPPSNKLRLLLKNGLRLGFGVLDIDMVSCSPPESSSQLSDSSSWNRAWMSLGLAREGPRPPSESATRNRFRRATKRCFRLCCGMKGGWFY